jgi:hypothetical protein
MSHGPTIEHLAKLIRIVTPLKTTVIPRGEDDVAFTVGVYALGAVASAIDLASGVEREARAGSSLNALRLARHLYEQRIDLAYLVKWPEAANRQYHAREAENRLAIARGDPRLDEDPEFRDRLLNSRADAARRDSVPRKERAELPVTERGLLRFSEKADGAGIEDEHDAVYYPASWLSHPGVGGVELFLSESAQGVFVRDEGPPAALLESPLRMALVALYSIGMDASEALGATRLRASLEAFSHETIPDDSA